MNMAKKNLKSKKTKTKILKITATIFGVIIGILMLLFLVILPIVSQPRTELSPLAQDWQDEGEYIKWNSTLDENTAFGELNIFTIQRGDPTNPAILMIHGYPTSSFDFLELFDLLSPDYYICAIDTPGYGLSDKPKNGYTYSIVDDAELIDYYIQDILHLSNLSILTHDKGDSVGLALLDLYQNQENYTINHHFITNGNIYLPLADLTPIQNLLLRDTTGPFVTKYMCGDFFAKQMNQIVHDFPESQEKVDAIASIIDYQDGGEVQYGTIQYLKQRAENEDAWLIALSNSNIPTSIIWGVNDPVAPTAVPDYVWNSSLKERSVQADYWQLPTANHYLQNDQPEILSLLIRQALGETVDFTSVDDKDKPIHVGNNSS